MQAFPVRRQKIPLVSRVRFEPRDATSVLTRMLENIKKNEEGWEEAGVITITGFMVENCVKAMDPETWSKGVCPGLLS